jgi:predicted nucleic acid-binding protein
MNWGKKVLWFVFGAASTALLMLVSTSRAIEPTQTINERVYSLERRVSSIEQEIKEMRSHPDNRREPPPDRNR